MKQKKNKSVVRGQQQLCLPARSPKVKLFCEMCRTAKRNEPLWYIKDKFYCSYCGMVTLVNAGSKEVKEGGFVGQDREAVLKQITEKIIRSFL